MSASPIARQATNCQAIPSRRVLITDPSQMPDVYSSTPGGTVYSTTPGGNWTYVSVIFRELGNNVTSFVMLSMIPDNKHRWEYSIPFVEPNSKKYLQLHILNINDCSELINIKNINRSHNNKNSNHVYQHNTIKRQAYQHNLNNTLNSKKKEIRKKKQSKSAVLFSRHRSSVKLHEL